MTSGKHSPNRVKLLHGRAMIYLNGKHGGVALVDLDDVDRIRQLQPWGFSHGYASGVIRSNSERRTILMHRIIVGAKTGQLVDHVNRNSLDNRKSNLRIASKAQNNYNSVRWGRFAGVTWHKRTERWRAQIGVRGKQIHLGHFLNRQDALAARLKAEIEHYGAKRPRRKNDRC